MAIVMLMMIPSANAVLSTAVQYYEKYLSNIVIIHIVAIFCFYLETPPVHCCPVKVVGLENTFHTPFSSVSVNYSSLKIWTLMLSYIDDFLV